MAAVGLLVAGLAGGALAKDAKVRQGGEFQTVDKSELAFDAQTPSSGGSCQKQPAVCQASCVKRKCDNVPNPVLCLTTCNAPKDCRAALAAGAK